jgi:SpoVK/Ycf46/Vps4 family AAA+-type ATPase
MNSFDTNQKNRYEDRTTENSFFSSSVSNNSFYEIINKEKGLNAIFEREKIADEIKSILKSFDRNCKNINFKKGIYIYGSPGCGKTEFVMNILKELNYDIIKYDAGDVRNKTLIETITSNNVSNMNVLDMMTKCKKKIVIVMDEIDGMNNGDKGGINSLIKIIRQKKTKKQRLENKSMNPIICIGNYYIDKKIKELIKVCNTFELKTPTNTQITYILNRIVPSTIGMKTQYKTAILNYIQGDIRKLSFVLEMFLKKPDLIHTDILQSIFHKKLYNEDSKKITQSLIQQPATIEQHNKYMNETDRTIVALLWHENIVDILSTKQNTQSFPFYLRILENMCYADYIDRITFQHQIWQFNEMSSLIKTFYNNKLFHDTFPANQAQYKPSEVRFTKVLTKYSTEYNNILFIYNLCQELDLDKKDLISLFQELRIFNHYQLEMIESEKKKSSCIANQNSNTDDSEDKCNAMSSYSVFNIEKLFENTNITKLDIKRMYRYLDKNIKKDSGKTLDDDLEEEFIE